MSSLLPLQGSGRSAASREEVDVLNQASWHDGRILFDRRRWRCEALDLEWCAEAHLIVATEFGLTSETHIKIDRCLDYRGSDRAGLASFIPARVARRASYRHADLVYSALWIEPGLATEMLAGSEITKVPRVNIDNPLPGALLQSLTAELSAGCPPETSYVERLAGLLLANVTRPPVETPAKLRGRALSQRTRRLLREYIEANLSHSIRLTELARIAGMPVDTFARAFKASTGKTPHAFIIHTRVARARHLLEDGTQSLGAIAFACGFSSQSHMTSVFKRATGITPGAYRSQILQ